jgi:hypothetical protein
MILVYEWDSSVVKSLFLQSPFASTMILSSFVIICDSSNHESKNLATVVSKCQVCITVYIYTYIQMSHFPFQNASKTAANMTTMRYG